MVTSRRVPSGRMALDVSFFSSFKQYVIRATRGQFHSDVLVNSRNAKTA